VLEYPVELAVLKRDVEQMARVFSKLDEAIEKIGEVSNNITRMLAVHEEKISTQERFDQELFQLVERRKTEAYDNVKDTHIRITSVQRELSMELEESEKKIMGSLTELKHLVVDQKKDFDSRIEKNQDRITKLENWRILIIGGAVVFGALVSKGITPLIELIR